MNQKEKLHKLINDAADELLLFVKQSESNYPDRWVPAADIKNQLDLLFPAVPLTGPQRGDQGWLFASLARILENKKLLEYKKAENIRAYYRSK